MKKLLVTTIIFLITALSAVNSYGQISNEDMRNPPKTDAEAWKYIEKYIKPKINDTLIARLFEEADLVFEGEIIESTGLRETMQALYELEPYKIFKGRIQKDSTLKIMTYPAPVNVQYLGEWSHSRGVALFFVKKDLQNKELYRFVNPKNAWVAYAGWFINPITFEKQYQKVLYDKILKLKNAKYEKTKFYYKKKEKLNVGKSATESSSGVITGFSHDTVPAGVLSGLSEVTIYGNGFGSVKGNVLMEDANRKNYFIALHPTHNILYWSNDSIQIVVPSMGFASATSEFLGDTRESCAGTGYIRVIKGTGPPIPIWSNTELIIPYAINNFAENSAFESLYTPYELRLHNADGMGGYTFVYDTSFYNNRLAMAAFRRAIETWRCATGIDFKQQCTPYELCQSDQSSTRILVSFDKPCFKAGGSGTNLAHTRIAAKLDSTCYQYYTDSITMTFKETGIRYTCGPDTITCPAIWNFDEGNNSQANAYNFEKVATHEIGHILLMQHLIDTTSLLYWKTSAGIDSMSNVKSPNSNILAGLNYILGRDTVPTTDCTNSPIQLLAPQNRCNTLPACADYCPEPNPNIPIPDFTAHYQTNCNGTQNINAIQTGVKIGQQIEIKIVESDTLNYNYTWEIGGNFGIDEFVDVTHFILHWNEAGQFTIDLSIDDNLGNCTATQYTINIQQDENCLMNATPLAQIIQPLDCATGTGSAQFANINTGSGCYEFSLYSYVDNNFTLLCQTTLANSICNDLLPGTYYAFVKDNYTGCYNEQWFDINTHSITTQTLSACGGGTGSIRLNISEPNNYTYNWSNGNTTQNIINVSSGNYTVTVTAVGGCSASASAIVGTNPPCFIDLQMRDNWNDIGQEPNTSAYRDDNGDGWLAYGSNDDWEDIWYSPDLWNCPNGDDCLPWEGSNPTATASNKMGIEIKNTHPSLSTSATINLYYSLANTGEVWESDWVGNNYPIGSDTCKVGNNIGTISIDNILPNSAQRAYITWTPPNYVNSTLNDYINPEICGLMPELDTTIDSLRYEICLLARLESPNDPINYEQGNGTPIRDNVLMSNNIVTRNAFLIDPTIGVSPGSPIVQGHPSVMLMANNNDEIKYLDLLFDKFSNGSIEALEGMLEISFVLSPELWEKWESTGKEGEGVQIIGEREVKITNMETAKLLNIPFDPREFQPFAIKVTILTSSGKRETLNLLPNDFSFRITHGSSQPINKPSNCFFILKDLPNLAQTAQILTEQLICAPNPFSNSFNVQFFLANN
jgi:hypothetical protein